MKDDIKVIVSLDEKELSEIVTALKRPAEGLNQKNENT